ncbi:MAG: hypothetical protein SOU13_12530 [Eubacteriales bacterium]|nr:hypothetical protein [Eubacteriales bacterium]
MRFLKGRNHREEEAGCGGAHGAAGVRHDFCACGPGGWGEWIIDPRTGEEVFSFVPQDWGNGELGDESIPLYALCGLAAIAAVGAVVMHKKRQRVG